jgi:hypothetical protein
MSHSPLHPTRFETIESYLLGTMPAAERTRFEADMAHDPALQAEVQLQRENMLAVELGGLRASMRSLMDHARPAAPRWSTLLGYAAAIALLVGAVLWTMGRKDPHERLFAEHFVPDPGLPVPMSVPAVRSGITSDPIFHDAMVAYKLGEHAEARTKWTSLLALAPTNDTLRYYIASATLAEGRPHEALPLLRAVAADSTSAFQDKARWYLFLTHLRNGDISALDSIPLDNDPMYGERSRAIKSNLK